MMKMDSSKYVRPTEVFVASNKKHREYYLQYMATNSWGNCPIQLKSADSTLSLATYAREQLIRYYISKEFNNDRI
jgi:hypothetical protein